jgi:DNA-binding winged helix-turn-helix (wHTH) protein
MDSRERYAFEDCVIDAAERQLWKGGRRVALAPKAHDVLVALVRSAGRLITKSDLLNQVWRDAFVEEGILAVHVSALRKALGDSNKSPRYIETVSRAGYRFIAGVRRVDADGARRFDRPLRPTEVYEHVGRGRVHLLSAAMREMPQAEAEFARAVALDPTYPEAHAGLALSYCAQAELRVAPPREAYARAKTAALRALALDDSSADAQVALGTVLFLSEWDWVGAERSLARAIDLDRR